MDKKNLLYHDKPLTLSAEELEAAKTKHKKLDTCTVVLAADGEGNVTATAQYLLGRPRRTTVELAEDMSTMEANRLFINDCVLAGDIELLSNDDEVYYTVLASVKAMVEAKRRLS